MSAIIALEEHLLGQGKARRTVDEYVKWVRRLARWCSVHQIDVASLEPWQLRLWADETVPPGRESRKQARAATQQLYQMLGRDDQPWLAIRVPAKRPGKPRPLTEPERLRLRDTAVMFGGRTGLATLGILQTAARAIEVAQWRWDGIDLDNGRIRFWREKVRDHHEVPLRPALSEALERFRGPYAEGFVFPGDAGRPHVHPATVWQWVHNMGELADLRDCNPRRLRATAISRVLETSGQLDLAAELAGHRDPSVTRNYYAATSWRRLAEGTVALD